MKKKELMCNKKYLFLKETTKLLFLFLFTAKLFAQTPADLRLEKAALEERLIYLQKEMEEENKEMASFLKQKNKLLQQKKIEQSLVAKEVKTRELEISQARREMAVIQGQKKKIQEENKEIVDFFMVHTENLLKEIGEGIPFEKESRKTTLSALYYDMKGRRISEVEAFSRFITFLDKEVAMGYNSQVVRAILDVKGKKLSGHLLRLGRIYFAFDTGENVYRFHANVDKKGYILSKDALSFSEQNSVRSVIDMIEGRTPPDLMLIDIPVSKQK